MSSVMAGRPARELVGWGWDLFEPTLREVVLALPARARTVVGYHFGWWDEEGRPGNGRLGKAVRPTLLLLSAAAVGGRPVEVARAAAALELVHNFSLVHDDVMDGDVTRHHRPTVWRVFGVDQAVLAGDVMLALATRLLAESTDGPAAVAVEWLGASTVRVCEGQFADLAFEGPAEVDLPGCLAMVADKTGSLIECSCALGALLAGAGEERIASLGAFGRALGVAFQVVDDVLGIWGDTRVTGKPVGADLARRKKTLPIVAALTSGTAAGRELAALYRADGPVDVTRAARLVADADGREWAERETADRLVTAATHLAAANCEPVAHAELLTLAGMITRRDH